MPTHRKDQKHDRKDKHQASRKQDDRSASEQSMSGGGNRPDSPQGGKDNQGKNRLAMGGDRSDPRTGTYASGREQHGDSGKGSSSHSGSQHGRRG